MSFSLRQHPAHRYSSSGTTGEEQRRHRELRRAFIDEDENGVVPPAYEVRAGPGTSTVLRADSMSEGVGDGGERLPDYVQ